MKTSLLILGSLLLFIAFSWAYYPDLNHYSPLTIKIKVQKETYKVGEPIDGKIVIQDTLPSHFPATFNIRLYHNKELFAEYKTELKEVFFGITEYRFQDFGIQPFNDSPAAEGEWNLSILQENVDVSHAAWVTIHIVPSQNVEEFAQKKKDLES